MFLPWQELALELGDLLSEVGGQHLELLPLQMAWVNFAQKRGLPICTASYVSRKRKGNGVIIGFKLAMGYELICPREKKRLEEAEKKLKELVKCQFLEIEALEYRIKTLMEH